MGLLMAEKVNALTTGLNDLKRPLMAIVGGSKVSTKLDLLNNLVKKVDKLVIAGGMAHTFLKVQGVDAINEKNSQLVEQRIRNAWVRCSSHLSGTTFPNRGDFSAPCFFAHPIFLFLFLFLFLFSLTLILVDKK